MGLHHSSRPSRIHFSNDSGQGPYQCDMTNDSGQGPSVLMTQGKARSGVTCSIHWAITVVFVGLEACVHVRDDVRAGVLLSAAVWRVVVRDECGRARRGRGHQACVEGHALWTAVGRCQARRTLCIQGCLVCLCEVQLVEVQLCEVHICEVHKTCVCVGERESDE